jgi:hypothetical protein
MGRSLFGFARVVLLDVCALEGKTLQAAHCTCQCAALASSKLAFPPIATDPMPLVELLAPEGHRRIPWKNGRGELVVIDREGGENRQDMGVGWHFGRSIIIEEGPISDYAGYERPQVVTKGAYSRRADRPRTGGKVIHDNGG